MRDLQDQELDPLSLYLLELCLRGPNPWKERQQRLEVFELCLLQGAGPSPGSPLSVLIYAGRRTELIQELLDKGAEVNAFSHDMDVEFPKLPEPWSLTPFPAAVCRDNDLIVNNLLERGADLNAPALDRLGNTALQSICAWMPSTSSSSVEQMSMPLRLTSVGEPRRRSLGKQESLNWSLCFFTTARMSIRRHVRSKDGLLWMALLSRVG